MNEIHQWLCFLLYFNYILTQDIHFPIEYAADVQENHDNIHFTLTTNNILRELYPHAKENVLFSPLSISMILAVLALSTDSTTKNRIFDVLSQGSEVEISKNVKSLLQEPYVKLANGIFQASNYDLDTNYLEKINMYNCEVLKVNYEVSDDSAVIYINDWVSNKTEGCIKDIILKPPSRDTKVILLNSMYFSAEWETKFNHGRKREFYPLGRKSPSVLVDSMFTAGVFPHHNDTSLNCQLLGLPYKGNSTVMYLIVPSKDEPLQSLEKRLTPQNIEHLIASTEYKGVFLNMPKMFLEQTLDLMPMMDKLNLSSAYYKNDLTISDTIHKSRINVTETGTVAAAASLITLARDGNRIGVHIDVPFIFFIYHRPTRNILYWGSVTRLN